MGVPARLACARGGGQRVRLATFALGVLAVLYGLVRPGLFPALWLAVGALLLVAAVTLHVMLYRQAIGITLDGSRRWVTLSGVHPNFVHAVNADEAAGRLGARRQRHDSAGQGRGSRPPPVPPL